MKPVHVKKLNDHFIIKWIATEMAISDGPLGEGPVVWEDPRIPYLQLTSIDLQLGDGSIYRMLSQFDDGTENGYFGLYLVAQDVLATPYPAETGSIYRRRELSELPVGLASVVFLETNEPNAVSRIEIIVARQRVSCWAAEVYEREDGAFEIIEPDESILVQVNGKRPTK
ncbi:hypothetical protein [Massilia aquatica]|uniref:Uncharacterized protein n=1 Tax=Massilia aquatica TaxID=2609000 RepID=A0ABX0MKY2_9BURK|nr:hypothetical protein [Massilia aquatica]NHZ45045.1 hypothetical protein [Massilia aquatica]